MSGAQPRRPPPPERPRFTSRAAVLAVVVCAIALSLAYPVREYIAQRRQIDQLQAQSQATTAELARLRAEALRLNEPAPTSSSRPRTGCTCACPEPAAT